MSPFTNTLLQWLPDEPSDAGFCGYLAEPSSQGLKAATCINEVNGSVCERAGNVGSDFTALGIKESLELGGTFKSHLVQLPCNKQGHAQLDRCSKPCPAWPWVYLGMGHPPPLCATCSIAHHPYCKRLFPYLQPKYTLFKSETVSPCSVTIDSARRVCPLLSCSSPLYTEMLVSGHLAAFSSPHS